MGSIWGPWAHGPMGLDQSRIDPGSIQDRSKIDPGSILDRSWIDPGSIQAHGPMSPWAHAPPPTLLSPNGWPYWYNIILLYYIISYYTIIYYTRFIATHPNNWIDPGSILD